ncbi:YqkE family protein [Cohnella sp. WQ 127256]|uniref:YqkE family protein n=1 Tax=Cohnella sp. WQ 127256 TaxID=2938790 RepID=UPI0021174004|nr:YqkE family protein [Cohnella sp. WQ 127256]
MANNKKKQQQRNGSPTTKDQGDKPVTLKDLLGAGTLAKLKLQAETLKQEENTRQENIKKEAEAARNAEQKLKENDFEYLLNNSTKVGKKYN